MIAAQPTPGNLGFSLTVSFVGFALSLLGAYVIFRLQRRATESDRKAKEVADRQLVLQDGLLEELRAIRSSTGWKILELSQPVLSLRLAELTHVLSDYQFAIKDAQVSQFCERLALLTRDIIAASTGGKLTDLALKGSVVVIFLRAAGNLNDYLVGRHQVIRLLSIEEFNEEVQSFASPESSSDGESSQD